MFRSANKLLAALLFIASGASQAFPDKPITMIVPFAAGSSTDVVAREVGQAISVRLKQPVVFDNKTGAEGIIAARAVLGAQPDGYTLLFTSSSLPVLDPLMKKNMPYDPVKDFAPICSAARIGFLMNITGSSPLKTAADVIAAARAAPGKLTFAYSSATTRLAGELFQQSAGIKLTGIPYRSSVSGLTEVAGGQADLFFIDHVSAGPFYQSNKLRPLVTAGKERMKAMPNVPSASEAGVPGYDVMPWFGVYAAGNLPPNVLKQVREAIGQALKTPEMAAALERRQLMPFTLCGDELVAFQKEEVALWRAVIVKAGIEPQ